MPGGIPLLVSFSVLPERSTEVVMREEQLFGGILVQRAEDTVMRDECFEFPSEGMPLNPVHHIPTVGSSQRDGPRGIDIRKVSFHIVESLNEIVVGSATPLVLNTVLECHAVSRAARGVGRYNYIALLGDYGRVPSGRPAVKPSSLWLLKD